MSDGPSTVSVRRTIAAPADAIFHVITDPARHVDLDGSGMIRSAVSTQPVDGVGSTFVMAMHYELLGDYEMINHVVDYERDRRLGWEPEAGAGHPEAGTDHSRWGHRWSFTLEPTDDMTTVVTHTYDCTRLPERLRADMDGGRTWTDAMAATLERLDALCR